MAWQRKTPFGYMIQNGEIIRHPQESGAVRDIFARYLLGESYSQIAGEMERLGIRYHPVSYTHLTLPTKLEV